MQILSICMPFLRMTKGCATVLSASAGENPWPGHTIFNAAMASLNMMVRCASLENASHGVRVNAVAPGMVKGVARQNKEFAKALGNQENEIVLNAAANFTPLKIQSNAGPGTVVHQLQEPIDVVQ